MRPHPGAWRFLPALFCCPPLLARAEPAPSSTANPYERERLNAEVDRHIERLKETILAAQVTGPGPAAGSFRGEMDGVQSGGVSALATYALLSSGVPWTDPAIERSVNFLAEHPMPGTYGRSLRAAVWAHLATHAGDPKLRLRCRGLMQKDVDWLVKALRADGFYGYDLAGTGGDHSCSQFGVLGVWTAESAGAEVPAWYWERVRDHWLRHQHEDGSWSYSGSHRGSATMTTAGVNTLYVVLAQLYAKQEPPFELWRGVTDRGATEARIDQALRAAERGFDWLAQQNVLEGGTYQLFGLERLGVASGRKHVGAAEWYRAGLRQMPQQTRDVIDASFSLLFLTYGRAPVLINKLLYGSEQESNYYYRDLHFLTAWLSRQHERIYKWQTVDTSAGMEELLEAPILLISGSAVPIFTPELRHRLREYVDAGGTIVGHADRGERRFAHAFRTTMESTFSDRGWRFEPLPAEHPVLASVAADDSGFVRTLGLEGISDGQRTCVFLLPRDVAGAWHQNLAERYPRCFDLMSQLRVYAAPGYDDLPCRLKEEEASPTLPQAGYLLVASLPHGDGATGAWRWEAFARRFARFADVEIVTIPPQLADLADVVHLSTQTLATGDDALLEQLGAMVRAGVVVLVEGAPPDSHAAYQLNARLAALAGRMGGAVAPIAADSPVLHGGLPRTLPVASLRPNRWATPGMRGAQPPIQVIEVNGHTRLLAAPFELLAPAAGHYTFGAPAYHPMDSDVLLGNTLATVYDEVTRDGLTAILPSTPRKRDSAALAQVVQRAHENGLTTEAARAAAALNRVYPHRDDLLGVRSDLARALTADINDARAGGDLDAAYRLGLLLADLGVLGGEPKSLLAQINDEAADLPFELERISVDFNSQPTTARALLREWFQWEEQALQIESTLRDLEARREELDALVQALVRGRGNPRIGGGDVPSADPRRPTPPEVQRIAAERREIEEQAEKASLDLAVLRDKQAQLNEVLVPVAERIAEHGYEWYEGKWTRVR